MYFCIRDRNGQKGGCTSPWKDFFHSTSWWYYASTTNGMNSLWKWAEATRFKCRIRDWYSAYRRMDVDISVSNAAHNWECMAKLAISKPYSVLNHLCYWSLRHWSASSYLLSPPLRYGYGSPQCSSDRMCRQLCWLVFGKGKWWTGFASSRELTEEKTHAGLCQTM